MQTKKIVVAVTGASGAVYASRLLKKLIQIHSSGFPMELAVIYTQNAKTVYETELNQAFETHPECQYYGLQDFSAPCASGSGQFETMIIIPCSMGTLGRIAQGISNDLITRAADVILKERRRLICVARETPYNLIHIKNMEAITLAGGIICPATPSFYSRPATVEEVIDTVVDRVIDLAGVPLKTYRWGS
jgi:flavin prenyltransferase